MDLAAVVALWTETLDPATSLAACNLAVRLPPQPWPEGADARQTAWLRQARKPAGRDILERLHVERADLGHVAVETLELGVAQRLDDGEVWLGRGRR